MSKYINIPPSRNKADFLIKNHGADIIFRGDIRINDTDGTGIVGIINNGQFEAAVYCHNQTEFDIFKDDYRITIWLIMDRKKIDALLVDENNRGNRSKTLEDYIFEYCDARAMFKSQIEEVIKNMKSDENDPLKKEWGRGIDGFPHVFYAVLNLTINRYVVDWIDKNLPLAWYRSLFIIGKEKDK